VTIAALAIMAAGAIAAWLWRRARGKLPAGWTAITDGKDYGARVEPDGSFDFPIAPDSVHYVTRSCAGLNPSGGIRMRYRIVADPGVEFVPVGGPSAAAAGPALYFQRGGDDWSGRGKYERYRWWATFATPCPIVPGEFEIIARFDQRWTAVLSSNSDDFPEEFREALRHANRVGHTWGGWTGAGHGDQASGKARFELIAFEPF
jgi:hypothetical protein